MIAMQYSFALPADYDMSIIDRRVRDKGHALDDHAPLYFKAYLVARKDDPITRSHENLYAPFYVWHDCKGMRDFICAAGFVGLVNSFGWPSIRSWPAIISTQQDGDLSLAKFATREIQQITPFANLQELLDVESNLSTVTVQQDRAFLALSAFEPTNWTVVRFRLWRDSKPFSKLVGAQAYNVQHVSNPAT
jgi:hypothetical protein